MTIALNWQHAKRQLNQTAHTYQRAAIVPHEIGLRLLDRLSFIRCTPQRILDIGSGCGDLLQGLKTHYPKAQVLGIDLALERNQQAKKNPALLITGDAHHLPFADHSMDLIISNLCLHWCLDLVPVLAEIHRVVKPEGIVLFSLFGPNTLQQLRRAFAVADPLKHVLPFYDMHDIGDLLLRQGFKDPVTDAEQLTLEYTDTLQVFRDLQAMGETNVMTARRSTLTGKTRWQKMLFALEQQRNANGKLPMSFEISYGYAFGAPKVSQKSTPQEYRINVADIRKSVRKT